jgi:hypothetical protein
LKKAPQKLFHGGQRYVASFLAEKLCFSASPRHIGKKESELSFFSYVPRTVGILFACEKNPPKMTWIALDSGFGGGEADEGLGMFFVGIAASFCKRFLRSFFLKKATLGAAAPRTNKNKS